MDRSEAYRLLTEEMNRLAGLETGRLTTLCDTTTEIDRRGVSGILYRVEMVGEQIADTRFAIVGKIHDNDTYRFSLLEERLEFDAGADD